MQSPDLPYDIFTACLTTPIKAALYWYVSQRMGNTVGCVGGSQKCGPQVKQMVPGLTLDMLDRIPGQINDRRTMMGELNWIFTAITDTIAWNVLDSDTFQVCFIFSQFKSEYNLSNYFLFCFNRNCFDKIFSWRRYSGIFF